MANELLPVDGDDAREDPVRLLVVQDDIRPAVDAYDEAMAMTFPHLVVRELIAFLAFSLVIVVVSLLFDAPLEEFANAQKTPNPAKAPWYFLGLQELLHYYTPLISGVVLPGLVVLGLVVVPYFEINLDRTPFWARHRSQKMMGLIITLVVATALFYVSGNHPVWPVIGSSWFVGALMLFGSRGDGFIARRSLSWWIFFWFLLTAVVLTVIGIFFRGPGWAFTVPWVDGIYY